MDATTSVSVVIVNLDGADHLPECLDSLRAQDYPGDLLEVIVVDNGSTDGSLELLRDRYPSVRVLPQDSNTGFAPAVNTGARAATGECLVLVNNDMRVDPKWLGALVSGYDPDNGVVCVAGQILSWDGASVDFVQGSLNFYGMGNQPAFGMSCDAVEVVDGARLLFACGGAMLVGREVFLETGGFDEGFFAYFEDIDFGWRLNLFGYEVRLAADARSYHRLHGTSSRFPDHQRYFLYERNALRSIVKNYEDETLRRVLAPALLLTVQRAMARTGLDRKPYRIGGDREPTEEVPRLALAHVHAIAELVDDLDELLAERAAIQRRRVRSDAELSELFVRPIQPVPEAVGYVDAQRKLVAWFGVDRVFQHRQATRLLALGDSPRLAHIASNLEDLVTIVRVPDGGAVPDVVQSVDAVLLDGTASPPMHVLGDQPVLVFVDLPAPTEDVPAEVLLRADVLLCASEDDRVVWAGRSAGTPLAIVGPDDGSDLTEQLAPLRAALRRPWTAARQPARRWTEDAQLVLADRANQIAALQHRVIELQEVVDHQERRLEQLRRIPGGGLVRRALRSWERTRGSGGTGRS